MSVKFFMAIWWGNLAHLRCYNICWVVLYVSSFLDICYPNHTHITPHLTPTSHLHNTHITSTSPTPLLHHIITTSHPHHILIHIHITSLYLHHPHLIYITSTSHLSYFHQPHHIYITNITPTSHPYHITPISHQDHIKITSTSLPYHTLHHIYTTPHTGITIMHNHIWCKMTRESHHIQRSSVAHLCTTTSYHSHWLQAWTAKCTKQGSTEIPQSVAKCSNTTSSKAPPPPHEHYLRYSPHWHSWYHDKTLYNSKRQVFFTVWLGRVH